MFGGLEKKPSSLLMYSSDAGSWIKEMGEEDVKLKTEPTKIE